MLPGGTRHPEGHQYRVDIHGSESDIRIPIDTTDTPDILRTSVLFRLFILTSQFTLHYSPTFLQFCHATHTGTDGSALGIHHREASSGSQAHFPHTRDTRNPLGEGASIPGPRFLAHPSFTQSPNRGHQSQPNQQAEQCTTAKIVQIPHGAGLARLTPACTAVAMPLTH